MDESLAPADLVTSKLTVRCFEEGAPLGTAPGILAVDILAKDNGFSWDSRRTREISPLWPGTLDWVWF